MGALIGFIFGYVVGAKAGPEGLEELRKAWDVISQSDEFQGLLAAATGFAQNLFAQGGAGLAGQIPSMASGNGELLKMIGAADGAGFGAAWARISETQEFVRPRRSMDERLQGMDGAYGAGHHGLPGPLRIRIAPAGPEHRYPVPFDDCLAALRWVHRNIADYGGDPRRLYVGGHSSGGHLYALVTLRRDARRSAGLPDDVIRACFPVSTRFNMVFDNPEPGTTEYRHNTMLFAAGENVVPASPLHQIDGNRVPFLLAWGARDLPAIIENGERMFEALVGQGHARRPARDRWSRSLRHGARARQPREPLGDGRAGAG